MAPGCAWPVPSQVPVHGPSAAKPRRSSGRARRFTAETDSLLEGTGFEPPVPLVPKVLLAANPGRRHEKRSLKAQVETPIIARSALTQLLRSRWDREFESVFPQRGVHEPSVPPETRTMADGSIGRCASPFRHAHEVAVIKGHPFPTCRQ